MQVVGAVILADVSDSTPLYEREGEAAALQAINLCLQEMREHISEFGGLFLHSKGDDVLAYFEDADAALEMAKKASQKSIRGALKIHSGLSWGSMLLQPDDVHGMPVNIAARLASLAKSHEVLLCETLFGQLSLEKQSTLSVVDALGLKGTDGKLTVYSHIADDLAGRTINLTAAANASEGVLSVSLRHGSAVEHLAEGDEVSLGRSPDADMVVSQPWVSRNHATISVMNGITVLRDHSTLGSFVRMGQGREIVARRNSVTLIGNGQVSLGAPFSESDQAIIEYQQSR